MSGSYSKALLLGSLVAVPPGISITATYFWPDSNLMEPQGFYFGRDFLNYWTGGRLALLGQADTAYDLARYNSLLRDWFSPAQSGMAFSYPPHALPLLAVFATLPYITAYVAWCLVGGAGFFTVALGRKPARGDTIMLAAIALAPILWVNFVFGQIGLLLAVLFVGALRALPTRPVLAGVLMGVLTIKPQLGLLLPLVLLWTGAWRAIAAAVATALAMVALSVALFGLEPWRLYVAETMPLQWAFVTGMNGFYVNQMITPYTAFWGLGVPVDVALILQVVVSCAILLTTFLTLRSGASWALKSATVAMGSVLLVPYVLAYDLAVPLAALVWFLDEDRPQSTPLGLALVCGVWALPYALTVMLQLNGIPLLPVALLATYAWLVAQALGWSPLRHARSAFAALRA
jgi:hypothetical protein